MSLTIDRLATRFRGPRRFQLDKTFIERVARDPFLVECARQFKARWPSQPEIIRIRRLKVRLRISPGQLNGERLAQAWAEALGRQLFLALARSNGNGAVEIVSAGSRAQWLAAAIADLLSGGASQRWEYGEFGEHFKLSSPEAILALLAEEPSEAVHALVALESRGSLNNLLARVDDCALEKLFAMMARGAGRNPDELSLEELLSVGRVIVSRFASLTADELVSRKLALRIFLSRAREPGSSFPEALSPDQTFQALIAWAFLLAPGAWTSSGDWNEQAATTGAIGFAKRGFGNFAESLAERMGQSLPSTLSKLVKEAGERAPNPLGELLVRLRPAVSLSVDAESDRLVSSDCAGLWLLAGIVSKLGWPGRLAHSSRGATYRERAITYTLTGIGLAALGRWTNAPTRIDPGLALFAGSFGEPDLAGFRRFMAEADLSAGSELLRRLVPDDPTIEQSAKSWSATFDCLAAQLIRELTSRLPGFRQASRTFVAKTCLAVSGSIVVEEKRVVVSLPSTPFNVVIHLSGVDSPIESVGWLGGRRLEFRLDGL